MDNRKERQKESLLALPEQFHIKKILEVPKINQNTRTNR